jgi:glycosyltransferase involved in cell wall biosynthesis
METYARELITALVVAAPDVRFTAFVNREAGAAGGDPWGELVPAVTVPVRARRRVEWVRGEQTLLPGMARRAGVDLLHSLASTATAIGRFTRVVTVHDLIYARLPEAHAGVLHLGMRVLVPLAVRRADRVIAVSEHTADDIVSMLHTPREKIDVVPSGLGQPARAAALGAEDTRRRFVLGERPVVLSLSAKRAHKNLDALIRAVGAIPAERRPVLVLPGYPTEYEQTLRALVQRLGLERDVRLLGWLPAEEVEGLWAIADAFAFPSLYEGFGLPVLEAMDRGVPVVSSNAASLPEVAGDAALLVDPHDERAIAAAIERVLGDPAEAQRLREAGRRQASRFSWERTARGTLETYRRARSAAGGGQR